MPTDFQNQFNADIDAIIAAAFGNDWITDAGNGTTLTAEFTLFRSESGDEFPVGDNSILRGELRWQESEFSDVKPGHVFKRVADGSFWMIPQESAPEIDGFGEVIATITKVKRSVIGAV